MFFINPRLNRSVLFAVFLIGAFSSGSLSRVAADDDSDRFYRLNEVVVSSELTKNSLFDSTAAVSVLTSSQIESLPLKNLADALGILPGIAFFNRDGLGRDPIASLRGFYGGGEAEYLLVLVDGRPLNDIETGLMNWDTIPLSTIESIEFLRGGVSSLYGDSAIGGIVNVVTSNNDARSVHLGVTGGTFGTLGFETRANGEWQGQWFRVYGSQERDSGFRKHADHETGNFGGSFSLMKTPNASLYMSMAHHYRRSDQPGPISASELKISPARSSSYYRFDRNRDRNHRGALTGSYKFDERVHFSGTISGEIRDSDVVRTLPLTLDFSDTKNRMLSSMRFTSSVQLTVNQSGFPFENRLVLGIDADLGSLSSEYYQIFQGGLIDYGLVATEAVKGQRDEQGDSTRRSISGLVQYDLMPIRELRFVLGGRVDVLRDAFVSRSSNRDEDVSTIHSVFSPKVGANYRYISMEDHTGNLYANVSRSFKAPTLDQLYDQRSIPVQFPPYKISLSNGELIPQSATSLEIGTYYRAALAQGLLFGELSFAGYRMNLKDELDFDPQQFKYVNIAKSRHQGIETGLKFSIKSGVQLFLNYTHQSATSQAGENSGKFLKAIPRDVIVTGATAAHPSGIDAGVMVKSTNRMFVDDANKTVLPNYTTVDARIRYQLGSIAATCDIFNIFGKAYSTTASLDASGSGQVYFYPAAGRHVRFNVNLQR